MFKNTKNLRLHIKFIHLEPNTRTEKRSSCPFCTTTVYKRHSMLHMEKAHADKLFYSCKRCYTRFETEEEKDNHEKNCTTKRFECFDCKTKLTCQTQAQRHMKSRFHLKKVDFIDSHNSETNHFNLKKTKQYIFLNLFLHNTH